MPSIEAFVLLTMAGVLASSPALAQDTPLVQPGARVRVTAPGWLVGETRGELVALDSLNLRVRAEATTRTIPLAAIQRFELVQGKKRHTLLGAAVGAGFAAGGVALVCAGYGGCGSGDAGAALGVVAFWAGIGAATGSLIKTDRWVEVPVGRLRIGGSAGASPGVRVSIVVPVPGQRR